MVLRDEFKKQTVNPQALVAKITEENKKLTQAVADMRDELLDRPVDIETERAKFAKNLETGLAFDKLTPEQKKEYELYDSTLKWLKKNDIKFYFFEAPEFSKIKNLDEFYGVKRPHTDFLFGQKYFEKVFGHCGKCKRYIMDELKHVTLKNVGKYTVQHSTDNSKFNVVSGERTTEQIADSTNCRILFYGPCIAMGNFVSSDCTIESYLIKSMSNFLVNVSNLASKPDPKNDFKHIRDTNIKKGDIIVLSTAAIAGFNSVLKLALQNNNIPYFELSQLFDFPNNYGCCFMDCGVHCNCAANCVIAKYIYKILKPEIEKYDETKPRKYVRMDDINDPAEKAEYLKQNPEFKTYLDSLTKIKVEQKINGNIGSIVMNCNPFTLGHRYLIESSAKKVDKLIIFVVEEDKSIYPFNERMELVKKGVSDLKNVVVLPSGKFIISLVTFPEYFVKGQKQKDTIDPSKDVSLFAKYIAPTMGIKTRFVGEEPYDTVTKQYNDTMRDFFPTYGLKFVEIKRKATDGKDDFISASKVRKLVEENKWEDLKKYVPNTTYDYLKNKANK